MAKIYTKTGDEGLTGLGGGQRVSKGDARIDCIGEIDELNAAVGLCAVVATVGLPLQRIQNELFILGSRLAAPGGAGMPELKGEAIARLEEEIDVMEERLPALRNFILPGGCELAGRLHIARTICRRAERAMVGLGGLQNVEGMSLVYLNRLSDWLFVAAREANQVAGVRDVLWKG